MIHPWLEIPMLEIQELQKTEDKLRVKYSRWSKIFFVIAILFIIWVAIVTLGIVVFEHGPIWALLTLEHWIYACCGLIGFFIILELIFYLHCTSIKNKRLKQEKPKPEFINSKRLHVYTDPSGAEGGIFSKTYISIDENHVLRLKTLMVPPGDLWSKKID